MSPDPTDVPPSGQATPPTQPGPLMMPRRASSWPKVIGIIAIVFAAGGLLQGGCGMLSPWTMGFFSQVFANLPSQAGQPNPTAAFTAMEEMVPQILVMSFLTMGIAGLLLAGGIGLVQRKARCVRRLKVWSVCKIVFTFATAVVNYGMPQAQMASMQTSMGPGAPPAAFYVVPLVLTAFMTVAWGCAFPIFLLIWFGRSRVKAEVAGWGGVQSAGA